MALSKELSIISLYSALLYLVGRLEMLPGEFQDTLAYESWNFLYATF